MMALCERFCRVRNTEILTATHSNTLQHAAKHYEQANADDGGVWAFLSYAEH